MKLVDIKLILISLLGLLFFHSSVSGGTTFIEKGEGVGIYTGETFDKNVFFLAIGANASF